MNSKRYTEAFKLEAIKQISERGYKVTDVARRLGVTATSLNDWRKKYANSNPSAITGQQEELRRLKAELRRVTEERNILKEAAAFFANESKKSTSL